MQFSASGKSRNVRLFEKFDYPIILNTINSDNRASTWITKYYLENITFKILK